MLENMRAFVADDDPELRGIVMDALADDGFDVTGCEDGRELLYLVDSVSAGDTPRPNVIICDIRMPHRSGLSVLAALKRRHVDIPVVLMSGTATAWTCALAKRLGAAAFFDKPFDLEQICTVVGRLARA